MNFIADYQLTWLILMLVSWGYTILYKQGYVTGTESLFIAKRIDLTSTTLLGISLVVNTMKYSQ